MFNFTDKVVLITGASGALGGAVVNAFETTGAHLALADRAADRLPGLFPELAASDDHYLCDTVDATDPDSVTLRMTQVYDYFGRIDVLVNTIGGYRAGTPVHETPLSTWEFMINLNARSAFVLSQAVTPHMLERKSGKIIHVAARAALQGAANAAAYTASKSAVVRIVESMAAELKDDGVNVNCVLPGTIDSAPNRKANPNADFDRWVKPESIADVILFLASDAARDIQGAAIPVYGRS